MQDRALTDTVADGEGMPTQVNVTANGKQKNVLRSPLPKCSNRVQNLGAPDMPRGKRTSAEVARIKAEATQLQKRIEELAKEKLRKLAEMEEDQEMVDREEEGNTAMSLEDTMLQVSILSEKNQ